MPAEPFSARFKSKDPAPRGGPSVTDALDVLGTAADSPAQHALVKRLTNEFDGSTSTQRPATSSDSPGMQAARSAMPPAFIKHAKGE